MEVSKILVIGATGYIGKHIAKASIDLGHPTFLLVRPSTLTKSPDKAQLIESFKASGCHILHGSLEDYDSLVAALAQVDVVISAVGHAGSQLADQTQILAAIKNVGTVKRFLPSEFGVDVDKDLNELMKSLLSVKVNMRRAIEGSGIPYTFVSANNTFGHFLANLGQSGVSSAPKDKLVIFGDGNAKAIYVAEEDIGTYTIKAVDDPRTINKIMYVRPPANILSQNDIVALWEEKIGKRLLKSFQTEQELLQQMKDLPYPANLYPAFRHAIYVRGEEMFEIGSNGVNTAELYPEVRYITADEYLNRLP